VRSRQPDVVTWADWVTLSQIEAEAGKRAGRSRVKLTRVAEMLAAIRH